MQTILGDLIVVRNLCVCERERPRIDRERGAEGGRKRRST